MQPFYPSNQLHRSTYFSSRGFLPYNQIPRGCSGTLCYTVSKGTFIYKPHSDGGMVGRTSAGYLAQRRRI